MTDTDIAPLSPNTLLGKRYSLIREIAPGATASIWEASDGELSRRVAVKVLHPHLAADTTSRRDFERNSVGAARLGHPGIVAIYDTWESGNASSPADAVIGMPDGTGGDQTSPHQAGRYQTGAGDPPFVVMEFVDGQSLKERIDVSGRLSPIEAVRIAARVSDALDCAHQNGLIHSELKPADILLGSDGRVKVSDFGITQSQASEPAGASTPSLRNVAYISPEQIEGRELTGRSDVYAVGILLYEMLAGTPPFRANSAIAVALARLESPAPDLKSVLPDIPPALARVVAKALCIAPEERFDSAAALGAALRVIDPRALSEIPLMSTNDVLEVQQPIQFARNIREDPGLAGPPSSSATKHNLYSLLAIVIFAALGVLLGFRASDRNSASSDAASTAPISEGTASLSGNGGDSVSAKTADSTALGQAIELPLASAHDFDPFGDNGKENPDQVDFAIDGDRFTAWSTEEYGDVSVAKGGVGLWIELEDAGPISTVIVESAKSGWNASIYVSAKSGSGKFIAPSTLGAWGKPVAEGSAQGTREEFKLPSGTTADAILIWITRVPDVGIHKIFEVAVES